MIPSQYVCWDGHQMNFSNLLLYIFSSFHAGRTFFPMISKDPRTLSILQLKLLFKKCHYDGQNQQTRQTQHCHLFQKLSVWEWTKGDRTICLIKKHAIQKKKKKKALVVLSVCTRFFYKWLALWLPGALCLKGRWHEISPVDSSSQTKCHITLLIYRHSKRDIVWSSSLSSVQEEHLRIITTVCRFNWCVWEAAWVQTDEQHT